MPTMNSLPMPQLDPVAAGRAGDLVPPANLRQTLVRDAELLGQLDRRKRPNLLIQLLATNGNRLASTTLHRLSLHATLRNCRNCHPRHVLTR